MGNTDFVCSQPAGAVAVFLKSQKFEMGNTDFVCSQPAEAVAVFLKSQKPELRNTDFVSSHSRRQRTVPCLSPVSGDCLFLHVEKAVAFHLNCDSPLLFSLSDYCGYEDYACAQYLAECHKLLEKERAEYRGEDCLEAHDQRSRRRVCILLPDDL